MDLERSLSSAENPKITRTLKAVQKLRILIVSDDGGVTQVVRRLYESGPGAIIVRIATQEDFSKHMDSSDFDLIIADDKIRGMNVQEVMTAAQIKNLPIILISDYTNVERAVEYIRNGATDYIQKIHLLKQLPYSIKAALEVRKERTLRMEAEKADKKSHELLKQLSETVSEILFVSSVDHSNHFFVSAAFDKIWGFSREILATAPWSFLDHVHPDDREKLRNAITYAVQGYDVEFRIIRPDGEIRWLSAITRPFKPNDDSSMRVSGVVRDITETKVAENLLRRESQLEEREAVLANMSHDLKNPLVGVRMVAGQMLSGKMGEVNSTQKECLSAVHDAANKMLKLIDTLIQVVRYERQIFGLAFDRVEIAKIIQEAICAITTIAEDKSISVSFKAHPHCALTVWGEESSLKRVLQNLLDNAIQYSPKGSNVTVELVGNPVAVVSVRDEGIGISQEDKQNLFQMYSRAEGGRRSMSSSGLGLYLCKQIVEKHKGTIWCESREGEGSKFSFTLPSSDEDPTTPPE